MNPTEFLHHIETGHITKLPASDGLLPAVHQFDHAQIQAVKAANAAQRPLLLRGEPGIGKSQLARAVAKEAGCAFISQVVDARTESQDLQWHFDAVARLAEAQIAGALPGAPSGVSPGAERGAHGRATPWRRRGPDPRDRLAVVNYLHPGPLWWAFHWDSAQDQACRVGSSPPPQRDGGDHAKGVVVLIDEIDKAEAELPNGLLEALGSGQITPRGLTETIRVGSIAPLVIITTNEERALPDAFVRRCLVLHMSLPDDEQALRRLLLERGRAHLEYAGQRVHESVLELAAELLCGDRAKARDQHWRPLPGQAEYLDLLWAVVKQAPNDPDRQESLIKQVANYLYRKHPDAVGEVAGSDPG